MKPAGSATGLNGGMRELGKAALRMGLLFTEVGRKVRSEDQTGDAYLRISADKCYKNKQNCRDRQITKRSLSKEIFV